MTGKGDNHKARRGLSLSKNKKRSSAHAVNTTPITSFFSNPQPCKLSCPLCGQTVPRFEINEHIDLQCKNFERTDSNASSASNVVSPSRTCSRSPQLDPELKEETKTSPYFKTRTSPNVSQEISSKTVVRKLELGSLSAKLSRTCEKTNERTHSDVKHAFSDPNKDTLDDVSISQTEILASQASGTNGDSKRTIELTTNAGMCTTTAGSSGKDLETGLKVSLSSSSNPIKRKKETPVKGKVSNLRKKPKHEVTSSTEVSFGQETGDGVELEPKMPSPADDDPLSILDNTSSNLHTVCVPEKSTSDQTGNTSPPQRLPYYLRNFQTVLQAVLENEDDRALFNQDDMTLVQAFEKLSGMLKYKKSSATLCF
uniref:Fanconi-associated nuclease n=1 Tax=Hippocampus comes TaxID=109280 RepID=A0A3Q2YAJ8_HIPCM